MYAIVKKTYLVPKPAPLKDGKPTTTAGQVKFVRVAPSATPQEFPDWMANTPIWKAASLEGSIIEVVLKNKPVASSNTDLAKARELGFVPTSEEKATDETEATEGEPDETPATSDPEKSDPVEDAVSKKKKKKSKG